MIRGFKPRTVAAFVFAIAVMSLGAYNVFDGEWLLGRAALSSGAHVSEASLFAYAEDDPPITYFKVTTIEGSNSVATITLQSGASILLRNYEVIGFVPTTDVNSAGDQVGPGASMEIISITPKGSAQPWGGSLPAVGITDQPVTVKASSGW